VLFALLLLTTQCAYCTFISNSSDEEAPTPADLAATTRTGDETMATTINGKTFKVKETNGRYFYFSPRSGRWFPVKKSEVSL